jgi:cytochrome c oxidase subunit IV
MKPSIKTPLLVWLSLLGLLLATWGFSRIDLKGFNSAIALAISLAKMLLIFTFFMELRSSKRSLWVVAAAGFIWILIFFDLTLSDYLTRGYSWSQ